MDLSNPYLFFSSFLIGLIGLAVLVYGRKSERMPYVGLGVVMMVYPYFVSSLLIMWLVAGGCGAAMYVLRDV